MLIFGFIAVIIKNHQLLGSCELQL